MELSLADFRKEHGITTQSDFWDLLSDWSEAEKVPALCRQLCEVGQGEKCEHGCPSIIVRMMKGDN